MASQIAENYLKALFYLSQDKNHVSISELSDMLQVSKPTVNSMIRTFQDQGLVNYEKYKPLSLTDKGKNMAAMVIRKHRLTEMFLVEKMGFGWEEVHEIAEQIEHIDSDQFFDRMDKMLGFPQFDPHGSPIPDKKGNMPKTNFRSLSHHMVGDSVKLVALGHSEKELLTFLDSKSLELGTTLKVMTKEDFDGSMAIKFNEQLLSLSKRVCDSLLVEDQPA